MAAGRAVAKSGRHAGRIAAPTLVMTALVTTALLAGLAPAPAQSAGAARSVSAAPSASAASPASAAGAASTAGAPTAAPAVTSAIAAVPAPQATPAAAPAGAARLVPLPPTRLVDTRTGTGAPAGPLPAGGAITVAVAGQAGVPAEATAVVLNATMTDTAAAGFLTIWPTGRTRPVVSNVNAPGPDATVANLAVVSLGDGGRLDLFALQATHVVLDVAGYFVPAPTGAADGRFVPLPPARILDTRTGNGAPAARPGPGATTRLTVPGRGGVPAQGAAAVALTLTVTETTGPGYVTAWPGDRARPLASNLNVDGPAATLANAVVVPVGADGTVALFTQPGAHLVVDVVGWFTGAGAGVGTDGLFVPLVPARALDTRVTRDRLEGRFRRDLALDLGAAAAGVVANLTVTGTAAPLYLTAYPARTVRPLASNVNADGGATRANLAVVPLTAGNRASVYPSASTDLVVDVAGWFTGTPLPADPGVAPAAPTLKGAAQLAGFDAQIEAFLAEKEATGATVAVRRGGRLVYARAYGATDAATGEAARIDSRFRLASLSKPLAAVAAMRLVEQGRLGLATRVWPLIDGTIPRPEGADPRLAAVTVGDLLRHSAGFLTWMDPSFNDTREVVDAFGPEAARSCPEGASWFLTWPLAYAPGEDQGYTNVDFCLLGAVLEAVTGEAWWQVVTDEVLRPAGMTNARVGRTRDDRQPNEAVHVTPAPGAPGGGWFMESLAAAGSWLGTAVDMARFVDALAGGRLVRPGTLATMLADPGIDPDATTAWWGLGLRNYGGGVWGHTGSLRQARAMFQREADGTSWVILVNGTFPDHGTELDELMARAMAAVPTWPTADLDPDLP